MIRSALFIWVTSGILLFGFSKDQSKYAERIDMREIPTEFPKIYRRPSPANWGRGKMTTVPTYEPNSNKEWQMDLRSYDLSELDLSGSLDNLLRADFDSQTIWPPDDRMPKDFDWKHVLELGKNPGLGVPSLHTRGITGRGVSIAIIDQPMLVEHQEYFDQIQLYEEGHGAPGVDSQMHGPAVASIAVGKTVGVAPEAQLYYIALWPGDFGAEEDGGFRYNFVYLAQGVRRILKINSKLPEKERIRVISMQIGWSQEQAGYEEITAACEEAQDAGMLVVCSCIEEVHGFKFHGLDRHPLADPDTFESYEPGLWWSKEFYAGERFSDRLLIPMGSRTTASPGGAGEYVFYRTGGWSWSMPYIAGMYALAVQVDPHITPDRFWSLAMGTGHTTQLEHKGEMIPFGPILDPVALIDALQNRN